MRRWKTNKKRNKYNNYRDSDAYTTCKDCVHTSGLRVRVVSICGSAPRLCAVCPSPPSIPNPRILLPRVASMKPRAPRETSTNQTSE
ncbi:hypothetical protein VTO73DRAFT_8219 [Trametes versicolor]